MLFVSEVNNFPVNSLNETYESSVSFINEISHLVDREVLNESLSILEEASNGNEYIDSMFDQVKKWAKDSDKLVKELDRATNIENVIRAFLFVDAGIFFLGCIVSLMSLSVGLSMMLAAMWAVVLAAIAAMISRIFVRSSIIIKQQIENNRSKVDTWLGVIKRAKAAPDISKYDEERLNEMENTINNYQVKFTSY